MTKVDTDAGSTHPDNDAKNGTAASESFSPLHDEGGALGMDMTDRQADARVYASVVHTLTPVWLRIVGPTPWWDLATDTGQVARRAVLPLYRQQSAALGLRTTLALTRDRKDAEYLAACSRAALIHWQGAIDPEGRPVAPKHRGSRLWPVVAQQVVRRLEAGYESLTPDLLEDLERHITWLLRRPDESDGPWVRSAVIETLALASPLVRQSKWLTTARQRLPQLLHEQSAEGWFRERGGADVGRLSLTLDALVRLYLDHGWEELREPLDRAVRFLSALVHPDGTAGGCYGSCDTGFVSPYAFERLASESSWAAQLAHTMRARYARYGAQAANVWSANLIAVLGSAIAATAAHHTNHAHSYDVDEPSSPEASNQAGSPGAPDAKPTTVATSRDVVFADGGLTVIHKPAYTAIVAGRRGGALQVRWHDTGRIAEYPGATVVFAHTVRTGRVMDAGYQHPTDDGTMSWRGILLRTGVRRTRTWRRLWRRTFGRWLRRRRGSVATRFQTDTVRGRRRLLHDWFGRDVTFHEDGLIIRDQVLCRLPSEAIVLESSVCDERWIDRLGENAIIGAPLTIEGGRAITIIRVYKRGVLESFTIERHVDLF